MEIRSMLSDACLADSMNNVLTRYGETRLCVNGESDLITET